MADASALFPIYEDPGRGKTCPVLTRDGRDIKLTGFYGLIIKTDTGYLAKYPGGYRISGPDSQKKPDIRLSLVQLLSYLNHILDIIRPN